MNELSIFILSDADSIHTYRWANALSERGYRIIVCSLRATKREYNPNITIHYLANYSSQRFLSLFSKLGYIRTLSKLKRILAIEKPDILHAHYASSYGLLGALCNFKPYIISVWGSDVFDFPKINFFTRELLILNLSKADKILSTSHVMAKETQKYTKKQITVTPFGIDLAEFKPLNNKLNDGTIRIGLVKTLEEKYGIKYLVKAVSVLKEKGVNNVELFIAGSGSQEGELKEQARSLGINPIVHFVGQIPYNDVPDFLQQLDLVVVPSILDSESFGVAAVEASACGVPVIASNVGGLPEVVENGKTGIIVEPKSPEAIAQAIITLLNNEQLNSTMGENGRKRVERLYNWEDNVSIVEGVYSEIITKYYQR